MLRWGRLWLRELRGTYWGRRMLGGTDDGRGMHGRQSRAEKCLGNGRVLRGVQGTGVGRLGPGEGGAG